MAIIDPKTDMVYGLTIRAIDGKVFDDKGREVVGWLYCDDCGEPVTVRLNVGKKPYYGCLNCNNQHRPQSQTSRKYFEDRMEKLNTKEVKNDNNNKNTSKETHQPSEASCDSPGERNETSAGRKPKLNIGFFSA